VTALSKVSQQPSAVELFLKNAVDCRNRISSKIGSPFNEARKHIWIGSVKDCVLSYFIDICTRAVHGPNKIDSHTRKSIKRLRFIFDGSFRKTKE